MSIGWTDVGGALLWVGIGLGVVAVVIALLVWDARRRRSPHVLLDVTAAVARMWLALIALAALWTIVATLTSEWVQIPALPLTMTWPGELPCQEPGESALASGPALTCASVQTADATATGLGFGIRLLLATGSLLSLVVAATPALLVAGICGQAAKGVPFSASTSRWLLWAAVVILVAGLGAELATGIGAQLASVELLPPPDAGGSATSSPIVRVDLPLWPIGAALALGALGAIFRHGAVLQRETAGLV